MWSANGIRPRSRRLSRYWNAWTAGQSAADLIPLAARIEPSLVEAIDRLAELDDARLPDPIFIQRLERNLMLAIALDRRTLTLVPSTAVTPGNGRYGLSSRPVLLPPPSLPTRARRWAGAQAATAIVLVLVLIATFFMFSDFRPAAIPPIQGTATPVATPTTPDTHAWPLFGGNPARTRSLPGTGPRGEPVVLWSYPAAGTTTPLARVDGGALADGVLYLPAATGAIVAIDATTGRELWQAKGYGDTVVVDGDGLIVHGDLAKVVGSLARISRADGSAVWTAEQGQIRASWSPVITDGVGYTPSGSDFIAFDPATGQVLWRTPLNAPASRGASVAGGLAVLGDERGLVYGIDTAGGAVVWTYQTNATTIGHPSLANGTAYVNLFEGLTGAYLALDAATGAVKWRYVSPSESLFNNAAIGETTVYAPTEDGTLDALDVETGALRWQFETGTGTAESPALLGDTLYFAGSGFAFALDADTGAERWSLQLDTASDSAAMVVDGVFYLSTTNSMVVAIGGRESAAATASPPPTEAADADGTPAAAAEFLWQATGGAQPFGTFVPNIAIAPDGRLWVADGALNQFQVFESDGAFVESWGTPGSGDGQFSFLRANSDGNTFGAVAFAPDGSFYVADEGNFRIQKFDRDRTFLVAWGSPGTEDGQFLSPVDIGTDAAGNVFVLDDRRNDIQKFTADGTFLLRFGGYGSGPGQLDYPGFMGVDGDGNVWVADPAHQRIEVWANDGRFLASWDGGGRLLVPIDVAIDDQGRVYVTEADSHGVVVLDRFGNVIGEWGGEGSGEGQFAVPNGIVLDGQGHVYVTDMFGPVTRVQTFKLLPPLGPA